MAKMHSFAVTGLCSPARTRERELGGWVYLADLLTRLVDGWPQRRIDEPMPWCWAAANNA